MDEEALQADMKEQIEKAILNRVKQDADFAQQSRTDRAQRWKEARDLYNSEWNKLATDKRETSLFIPEVRSKVTRLVTLMVLNFFGSPQFCKVRPQTLRGTDPLAAKIMQRLLSHYVDERMATYSVLTNAFLNGFVDDSCIVKLCWDRVLSEGQVVANAPILSCIPVEDVLWDPFPVFMNEIRYIIHWKQLDIDDLWAKQEAGIYQKVEKLESRTDSSQTGPAAKDGLARDIIHLPSNPERKVVGIYEYYGSMQLLPPDIIKELRDKGQNVPARDIILTCDDECRVLLRGPEPNVYAALGKGLSPYQKLPFIIGYPLPGKVETEPESLVYSSRDLVRELNMIHNERRDNVILNLNPKTMVERQAGVNIEELERARIGGIVTCDNKEGLREWVPGNVTQSAYREEEILAEMIDELYGVTDFQPLPDTATGIVTMNEQSNTRMGFYSQNYNKTLIVPLLEKLARYIIKWAEPEEVRKILGAEVVMPPLEQVIDRQFDIQVEAGIAKTSEEVRSRRLMQAYQIVGQMAQMDPESAVPALRKIMQKILPLLDIYDVAQDWGAEMEYDVLGQEQPAQPSAQRLLPPGQAGAVQQAPTMQQQPRAALPPAGATGIGMANKVRTMQETPGVTP